MAATLATGGVLSHATAAAAWELLLASGAIHVTIPGDPGRKRRAGSASTAAGPSRRRHDVRRGIPITTPERTIATSQLKGRPLEQLVDRDAATASTSHGCGNSHHPPYKRCCPATRRAP